MTAFCQQTFACPPVPDFSREVVNEAPLLFRQLADPGCRCVILADPFVRTDASAADNRHYRDAVPLRLKQWYYAAFRDWYAARGFIPLCQPESLTDPQTLTSAPHFARHDGDDWHMNDAYWAAVVDGLLWPVVTGAR